MKSAVTISLVEEARGGPFVFWHDLPAACATASELGFDAIEIFAPSPDAVDTAALQKLLADHNLKAAAFGTGGGWVIHKRQLCDPDSGKREDAKTFIKRIIDLAGPFGAPAIIGSMQGRWGGDVDKDTALGHLREALNELGAHAKQYNVPLIYEPLNRYETNLINTVADGVAMCESLDDPNVTLLCDLFHMNIEEANIADALRTGGKWVGHVHFVDSNRRPAGCGHMNYEPIIAALRDIKYTGYLCAEALPYPDPDSAAKQTIDAYNQFVGAGANT